MSAMRLQQLLRLAGGCKEDNTLLHNHIINNVLTDLQACKTETLELIELIENDQDFSIKLNSDLNQINSAMDIYEDLLK